MDLDRAMQVALRAAYRGAEVLRSAMGGGIQIQKKGLRDLVTDADLAAEREIVQTIRAAYPEHAVIAEESGASEGISDYRWVVDPLDGTVNFAHRLPFFAVSIALEREHNPLAAVVLNPVSGELFSAMLGNGARLNGNPIRVSDRTLVSESLLATGFPYNLEPGFDVLTARFRRCLKRAQGIRRLGSAALDLCFVACGRFDGFWEQQLKPWDTAAGILIVREAGGSVTDFSGGPNPAAKKEVLATNCRIHPEMLALMEEKNH
jgi:myo-inositol-1(or 4)-monophosphatase